MLRPILILAFTLLTAVAASAQDSYPRVEVFGGYSYLKDDFSVGDGGHGPHGWAFSIAGNLTKNIGLAADISGHYGKVQIGPSFQRIERDSSAHVYLFGPRLSARLERGSIFAHLLAGRTTADISGLADQSGFSLGAGGGADLNVSKRVAMRVFQFDYIPVRVRGSWINNVRLQAGFTVRLGGD